MFEILISPEELEGPIKKVIQDFLDLYSVLGTDTISGTATLSPKGVLTIELSSKPTDEFNWAVADTFGVIPLPSKTLYCTKFWKNLSEFGSLKELEKYLSQ